MSLLSDVQGEAVKHKPCKVLGIALADSDRADLDLALADPSITHAAIVRALRARGCAISEQTIRRHRRRECSCGAG